MPLEIRELVIKATLGADQGTGSNNGAGSEDNEQGGGQAMIQNCVEKVLAILKERNER